MEDGAKVTGSAWGNVMVDGLQTGARLRQKSKML